MKCEKILFVGHTAKPRAYLDPSTRYRCFNIAYALKKRGHAVEVITLAFFLDNIEIAEHYNYIVFHRPHLSDEKFIRFLQENYKKKNLIADFDDLIFDTKSILDLPEIDARDPYLKYIPNYVSRTEAACHYFKRFSVSTKPLAERLDTLFPDCNVSVISNSLENEYVDLAKKIFSLNKPRKYKLGYFPGTASHHNDFKQIVEYVAAFLKENKKERFFILGPLKIPPSLRAYYSRIDHIQEVVPFHHLPYIKANVETIIAPLLNNEFNNCKSGLKFFEAMPLGCRVIATAISDIEKFDSVYLDKCYKKEDWSKLLNHIEIDRSLYHEELNKTLMEVDADKVCGQWIRSFLI